MVRGVNSFDVLDQVESELSAFTDSLGGDLRTADSAQDAIQALRRLRRLTDFATAGLLRQLINLGEVVPSRRTDRNALLHRFKFTRGELAQLLQAATDLFPTEPNLNFPNGRPIPLPHASSALRSAEVELASCDVITKTLDFLPDDTRPEVREWVELTLTIHAKELCPDDLKKAAAKVIQGLGLDELSADKTRQNQRSAQLSSQGINLMSQLKVECTPQLDALLRRLFADYAGPGDLLPATEKDHDTRTQAQRQHDALVTALKFAVHREGPMPPTRGCASVVVSMTRQQLADATGVATTDVGTTLSIPDLLRLGADRDGYLAILDESTGNLIELGRHRRQASVFAYIGLVAAQGGDQTPGSDLPAARCEIHHIHPWNQGGRSHAANLALVGHATHREIDDTQQTTSKWWTLRDEQDRLVWIPPTRIDPLRRPCLNYHPGMWLVPGMQLRFNGMVA